MIDGPAIKRQERRAIGILGTFYQELETGLFSRSLGGALKDDGC